MINPAMQYSERGLKLTEQHEGLRLLSYQDQGGVWTIGYGHTSGVFRGQTITKEQAEAFLKEDIAHAVHTVNSYVNVSVTQGQFDALVDFTFNVGSGAFSRSTLLTLINQSKFSEAADQFGFWVKVAGRRNDGLVNRRAAEVAVFQS